MHVCVQKMYCNFIRKRITRNIYSLCANICLKKLQKNAPINYWLSTEVGRVRNKVDEAGWDKLCSSCLSYCAFWTISCITYLGINVNRSKSKIKVWHREKNETCAVLSSGTFVKGNRSDDKLWIHGKTKEQSTARFHKNG